MILPAAIFSPFLILFPVIVWLFYRKEANLLARITLIICFVWCLATYYWVYSGMDKLYAYGSYMCTLPAPGFIVFGIILIK